MKYASLIKSKVKFVLVVGVREQLLTSFSICLYFALNSKYYCLTLEGKEKKKPLACC